MIAFILNKSTSTGTLQAIFINLVDFFFQSTSYFEMIKKFLNWGGNVQYLSSTFKRLMVSVTFSKKYMELKTKLI